MLFGTCFSSGPHASAPGCKGSGNWNSLQPSYLSIVYMLGLTGADGTNNETGAKLVSIDADPDVWGILEINFAEHKCNAQVVRGTMFPSLTS